MKCALFGIYLVGMGGFLDGNIKYIKLWLLVMAVSMGPLWLWIVIELAIKRYKGMIPISKKHFV